MNFLARKTHNLLATRHIFSFRLKGFVFFFKVCPTEAESPEVQRLTEVNMLQELKVSSPIRMVEMLPGPRPSGSRALSPLDADASPQTVCRYEVKTWFRAVLS